MTRPASFLPVAAALITLPASAVWADLAPQGYHAEAFAPAVFDFDRIAAASPHLEATHNDKGEADGMVMLSDVLFEFGKAQLTPQAVTTLAALVKELEKAEALEITGHTDHIGTPDNNVALAQRRADAVRSWLVNEGGLRATTLTARGIGETEPVAANLLEDGTDNPDGRARNRRVEFHIPEGDTQEASTDQAALAQYPYARTAS